MFNKKNGYNYDMTQEKSADNFENIKEKIKSLSNDELIDNFKKVSNSKDKVDVIIDLLNEELKDRNIEVTIKNTKEVNVLDLIFYAVILLAIFSFVVRINNTVVRIVAIALAIYFIKKIFSLFSYK